MFTETEQQTFRRIIEDLFGHLASSLLGYSAPCYVQSWQILSCYQISVQDKQCKVIFTLRDLPEYEMCFKCLNVNRTTNSILLEFFVQHRNQQSKFTYTHSYLKDLVEYCANPTQSFDDRCKSLKGVYDIIQFMDKQPALAYYYSVYGMAEKRRSVILKVKAAYTRWRDKLFRHKLRGRY